MSQLIGTRCVVCKQPIQSILDGGYCGECGNPVHQQCKLPAGTVADPGSCNACGGNLEDAAAREVREVREQRQRLMHRGRAAPVSERCPECGSAEYHSVKASRTVAFANDRVCTECGTRYSPPTPAWASMIFILGGLFLAGAGGMSILLRWLGDEPWAGQVFFWEGSVIVVGFLCVAHGIRSFLQPGEV